jgi:hypothetical protein
MLIKIADDGRESPSLMEIFHEEAAGRHRVNERWGVPADAIPIIQGHRYADASCNCD